MLTIWSVTGGKESVEKGGMGEGGGRRGETGNRRKDGAVKNKIGRGEEVKG